MIEEVVTSILDAEDKAKAMVVSAEENAAQVVVEAEKLAESKLNLFNICQSRRLGKILGFIGVIDQIDISVLSVNEAAMACRIYLLHRLMIAYGIRRLLPATHVH